MAKPRTVQEINNNYYQKASELGHLHWQMEVRIPKLIEKLHRELKAIDEEADMASERQRKEEKDRQLKEQMNKSKGVKDPQSPIPMEAAKEPAAVTQ